MALRQTLGIGSRDSWAMPSLAALGFSLFVKGFVLTLFYVPCIFLGTHVLEEPFFQHDFSVAISECWH